MLVKNGKGCVILAEIRGQRSFRDPDPDPEIFREKTGFPDPTGSQFFGILDTLAFSTVPFAKPIASFWNIALYYYALPDEL